jgi:hypothetical protein
MTDTSQLPPPDMQRVMPVGAPMMGGQSGIVRVVNVGDRPFRDRYNRQWVDIPVGGEQFVPFEAVCLWFGNPDVMDKGPRQRDRTDTYQRLRARLGVYENEALWESRKPKVECYTINGDRIITVMDDPYGTQKRTTPDMGDPMQQQVFVQLNEMRKVAEEQATTNVLLKNFIEQQARRDPSSDSAALLAVLDPELAATLPPVQQETFTPPQTPEDFMGPAFPQMPMEPEPYIPPETPDTVDVSSVMAPDGLPPDATPPAEPVEPAPIPGVTETKASRSRAKKGDTPPEDKPPNVTVS